jgi:transcriptional regulator with XRE-family HTH domain
MTKMERMKLATQLRYFLDQNDVTVSQLGRAVKVSPKTIYSWMSGQRPRDISQVKSIANYFEISLDQLLFGEMPNKKIKFQDFTEEINAGHFEVILRRTKQK